MIKPAYTTDCSSILGGWRGGKYRLAREIISLMPEHEAYCEPFCGAAWVFFKKTPSAFEILNDKNCEISNLFEVLREQPEELLRLWSFTLYSRPDFDKWKLVDPAGLDPLLRAWRFLFLHAAGYPNQRFASFAGGGKNLGPRTLARFDGRILACASRLRHCIIETGDWQRIIQTYDRPGTFFYLDPPYLLPSSKHYATGDLGQAEFCRMASVLKAIKGKFILSLNDCPEAREIFSGFHIQETSVYYSINVKSPSQRPELLIMNYEPDGVQQEILPKEKPSSGQGAFLGENAPFPQAPIPKKTGCACLRQPPDPALIQLLKSRDSEDQKTAASDFKDVWLEDAKASEPALV